MRSKCRNATTTNEKRSDLPRCRRAQTTCLVTHISHLDGRNRHSKKRLDGLDHGGLGWDDSGKLWLRRATSQTATPHKQCKGENHKWHEEHADNVLPYMAAVQPFVLHLRRRHGKAVLGADHDTHSWLGNGRRPRWEELLLLRRQNLQRTLKNIRESTECL